MYCIGDECTFRTVIEGKRCWSFDSVNDVVTWQSRVDDES
jgi:hypothetical protein